MVLPYFWVRTSFCLFSIPHFTTMVSEVPYALPPNRFEDPHPLPVGFKYADIDYIYESSCAFHRHAWILEIVCVDDMH